MFLDEVRDGMEGKSNFVPGKFPRFDAKAGVLWKKMLYVIGAHPKVGKTAFVDERYILYPYLNLPPEQLSKLHYKYFSYEIDIVEKMANYASYLIFRKHNLRISADTILGRIGKLTPQQFELVRHIYETDLQLLFGKFDMRGKQLEPGIIEFFQTKENPTGIMKRLFTYAASKGHFEYEQLEGKEKKGRRLWYEPHSQYKDDLTITILDHVGLVPRERGFNVKENIDKLSEYFVELRNDCKFTFIVTSQFNRELGKTDRLKFSGEQLAPTLEDFKNTGNLAEDFSVEFVVYLKLIRIFVPKLKNYGTSIFR